jgi:Helix-turn-helix domain
MTVDHLASAPTLTPLLVNERGARLMLGGLCAKTMYNLRRAGELPVVKIGSRIMYEVADLRAFIARQKGAGHE